MSTPIENASVLLREIKLKSWPTVQIGINTKLDKKYGSKIVRTDSIAQSIKIQTKINAKNKKLLSPDQKTKLKELEEESVKIKEKAQESDAILERYKEKYGQKTEEKYKNKIRSLELKAATASNEHKKNSLEIESIKFPLKTFGAHLFEIRNLGVDTARIRTTIAAQKKFELFQEKTTDPNKAINFFDNNREFFVGTQMIEALKFKKDAKKAIGKSGREDMIEALIFLNNQIEHGLGEKKQEELKTLIENTQEFIDTLSEPKKVLLTTKFDTEATQIKALNEALNEKLKIRVADSRNMSFSESENKGDAVRPETSDKEMDAVRPETMLKMYNRFMDPKQQQKERLAGPPHDPKANRSKPK